ncbi:hypothetical protein LXL04_031829 [Taraxacum kok-saghyz]
MRDTEINDNATSSYSTGVETRLLNNFVDGAVEYKGRPVLRSKSGLWRSAYFIIGVEVAERFAYYGVSSNLIDRILRTIDGIGGRERERVDRNGIASSPRACILGPFQLYSLHLSSKLSSSSFHSIQLHLPKVVTSPVYKHLELTNLMLMTQMNAEPKAHSSIGSILECVRGLQLGYLLLATFKITSVGVSDLGFLA